MVTTRRRLAATALVVAAIAGIVVHEATDTRDAGAGTAALAASPGGFGEAGGPMPVVTEWAPADAIPAVHRTRAWGGAELLSSLPSPRDPAVVPVAGAVAGAAAAALAWWLLGGPGGAGARLRRTPLPVLRAPPAPA